MSSETPLVSYIIPTAGSRIEFTEQTLASIRNQTYKNIEIILCIDITSAMKGGNFEHITEYADRLPDVRVVFNKFTPGPAATRNIAIKNARGHLIALLDDDDTILTEKTEHQVQYFNENPDSLIVGTWFNKIDPQNEILGTREPFVDGNELKENFLRKFPFLPSACMINKELFDKIGYFDTTLKASEDSEYFYRALLANPGEQFHNIPIHYTNYRIHGDNISHTKWLTQRMEAFKTAYQYAKLIYGTNSVQIAKLLAKHTCMLVSGHPKIKPYARRLYQSMKGLL